MLIEVGAMLLYLSANAFNELLLRRAGGLATAAGRRRGFHQRSHREGRPGPELAGPGPGLVREQSRGMWA